MMIFLQIQYNVGWISVLRKLSKFEELFAVRTSLQNYTLRQIGRLQRDGNSIEGRVRHMEVYNDRINGKPLTQPPTRIRIHYDDLFKFIDGHRRRFFDHIQLYSIHGLPS
jgi:hypothetical protein